MCEEDVQAIMKVYGILKDNVQEYKERRAKAKEKML